MKNAFKLTILQISDSHAGFRHKKVEVSEQLPEDAEVKRLVAEAMKPYCEALSHKR